MLAANHRIGEMRGKSPCATGRVARRLLTGQRSGNGPSKRPQITTVSHCDVVRSYWDRRTQQRRNGRFVPRFLCSTARELPD